MRLQVTAWPKIGGQKYKPGDEVDVAPGLAKMLIRDGQARVAGTPEPAASGQTAAHAITQAETSLPGDGTQASPPLAKPGRGASKDELVAYAISQGLDADTAHGMSRAQLTAHVSDS